jgi:hypothetical protein
MAREPSPTSSPQPLLLITHPGEAVKLTSTVTPTPKSKGQGEPNAIQYYSHVERDLLAKFFCTQKAIL